MRVKEDYYNNLERVKEAFPHTELIRVSDAVKWLGGISARSFYEDRATNCKKIGGKWFVTSVALARWLA